MDIAEELDKPQKTPVAPVTEPRSAGELEYDSWYLPSAGELEYRSWSDRG